MCFHSTIDSLPFPFLNGVFFEGRNPFLVGLGVICRVLDICIATHDPTFRITVSPSAYPCYYSKAFASDSISPNRCIQLALTWYRPTKSSDRLLRSEQPLLEPLEMVLSTGFNGSACWSCRKMPAPYPLPFGSSVISFRIFSLISLVPSDDGSNAPSLALSMGSCSEGTGLGC